MMLKKVFVPLLLLAAMLTGSCCFASPASIDKKKLQYPPDIQRIIDRGVLVVAMYYKDIPPFFMHDSEGKFYGQDVELALDIGEKLGVTVKFDRQAKNFSRIVDMIANHEADVAITVLSKTLNRAKRIRFTAPYLVLRQGLLLNRLQLAKLPDRGSIMKTLNQPEAGIGVKDKSSYVEFAEKLFTKAQIQKFPEWDPEIVQAVVSGKIVAAYYDEIEIKKYIIRRPEAAIHVNTAVIQDLTDPIAIAVPYDSLSLLAWLNIYLELHVKPLSADQLIEKYMKSLL